jgi:hypothetical protein
MKRHDRRARTARRQKLVRLEVEVLEARDLPSAQPALLTNAIPSVSTLADGADALTALPATSSTPAGTGSGATAGATVPLSSVPALSSLPGAKASIWLNFAGDFQAQWGSYTNITTPAFDEDGNPSSFSSSELQSIQEIWQVVAEDYAPFNINVTTVKPANMGHGFTQQVDIGGTGAWSGGTYGGITYVGSFSSPDLPNISYVFSANLDNGNPIDTGDAISHEVGHSMGLNHQRVFNANGTLANEYNPGTAATAPIMGYPYSATRALWWDGPSASATSIQDDMAVIASAVNGFGYRPEPSNTSAATASPLTVSGTQVSASGLIIHTTDKDYFSFTTGAGQITLSVNVAFANDLAPTIELLAGNGQTVLAADDPSPNFNATITTTTVAAGTYYVVVGSHGDYGDVGQYTISGTIAPVAVVPSAPTGLTAVAGVGQVSLSWNAVSGATSYDLYRGTRSGGETLVQSGITSTQFTDSGLSVGTTYYYQVSAVGSGGQGSRSGEASATPLTPPPVGNNPSVAIDAGGGAVGTFSGDTAFSGGSTYSTGAAINTSGVSNPAPQAAYQTERYGNFTYTIPNLTPGGSYSVRLDFAEIYWNAAGKRLFNVSINGQQVLTNFDIFATAGGMDKAIAEQFTAKADASGRITIVFTTVRDNAKVSGIEITPLSSPPPTTGSIAIRAGGGAVGSFVADTDFSGGSTYSTGAAINTSGVSNPAPQAVYQTERYGNFTYTVPNLTPGGSYSVRLDFAEIYWNAAGKRLFNVSINGQQVLTNFDIFATAGGMDKAIAEQFTAKADASGRITIVFTTVRDNAKVSGIEIIPVSGASAVASKPAPASPVTSPIMTSFLGWQYSTPPSLIAAVQEFLTLLQWERSTGARAALDAFFAQFRW